MPWGPLSHSSWGLPSWVRPGGIHAWCFIPKLRAATLGVTQQGCTPRAALHGAVHWVNLGKSLVVLCHSNKKWSVQPNGVSIATGKNEKLGQKTQEGIAVVPHPLGCRDDKNFEGLLFRVGKLIYCLVKNSTKVYHNPVWVILLPSFPPREGHLPHDQERSQDLHSVGAEGNIGLNCLGRIYQVSFPAQP